MEKPKCEACGKEMKPAGRNSDGTIYYRGWRCQKCSMVLCKHCHSPVLGQPCPGCGNDTFDPV